MAKFIFICGGVISGCGKGVASASIGLLMKLRGHKVQIIKFDPYLNINAGILSPAQHGECFLCDDGTETDLDLGHYSRIAGVETSGKNICTSGTLFKELIEEQTEGKFIGQTLQIIPHLTNKIQQRLEELGSDHEIVIAEIGGTIGDIESGQFYEAIRQFKQKKGDDVLIIMVAPILWVDTIKEFKTKPLQNAVKDLQRYGLQPDALLCRVSKPVPKSILDKISDLTNVPDTNIFDAPDVASIYHVPIAFYDRQVDDLIVDKFRLKRNACRIGSYRELVERQPKGEISVGIIGKYDNCEEAYLSLKEALSHVGMHRNININIKWVNAEEIDSNPKLMGQLKLDAAIVPGGFDKRGVEGKIKAIKYIREHKIPFLGICLGLQCAVIEFARNVCGLTDANSLEFNKNTSHPVIHYVAGQEHLTKKLGTMRLGAYNCELIKDSKSYRVYNKKIISERHRHRYEVNPNYQEQFHDNGLIVSGVNPETGLIEMMELKNHPFFIGTQAHPEFRSQLIDPAPLFDALILTAIEKTAVF